MNFENELRETLDRYLSLRDEKTPPNLAEAMRYSLLAPGKRIRARLLLACGQMLNLAPEAILPAAVAMEMVHCFTLIHDDLPCMDNDDFRRGMPSNHKQFGEAIALLAGDALLAMAAEVFLDVRVSHSFLISGLKRLLSAAGPRGVIGGQASESLLQKNSTLEDLYQMHRQKTGALFSAALLIPRDLAGLSSESSASRSLVAFADTLGLAFQIIDDLDDDLKSDPAPTHILFYTSREEAYRRIVQELDQASVLLRDQWGSPALDLIAMAEKVIKRTE